MATPTRMKAADRKRLILDAAITEYGRAGLHETSTEAIAERAGISQPYLFRLFGTKKKLIIAAIGQHADHLRDRFAEVAEQARNDGADILKAMGDEYARLLVDEPDSLRCQLHSWAAASDPELGDAARASYLQVIDDAQRLSGQDRATVLEFMAWGMLMTVAAALDLPDLLDPNCPKGS